METVLETFSQLSTFELIELQYLAREAVGVDVTIFVSLVFSYITVAYFVGKKLNRFETVTVSTLFSIFALFNLNGVITETGTAVVVTHILYEAPLFSVWRTGFVILMLLIWVFSLFFMYRARRK